MQSKDSVGCKQNSIIGIFETSKLSVLFVFQSTTLIAAGLGIAVIGFAGRFVLRQMPHISKTMSEAVKSMPKLDSQVIWLLRRNLLAIRRIRIYDLTTNNKLTIFNVFLSSRWQTASITKAASSKRWPDGKLRSSLEFRLPRTRWESRNNSRR